MDPIRKKAPFRDHGELDPTSRRHRPASEIRFPEPRGPEDALADVTLSFLDPTAEEEALRAGLWDVVRAVLFVPTANDDRWSVSGATSPTVRRVWSSPPLSGDPDEIGDDIAEVLEGWFSLIELTDALAFLETVYANIDAAAQQRFESHCNATLERHLGGHRFVMDRLVPISARSDIATIERAFAMSKSAHGEVVDGHLRQALDALAEKPVPDSTRCTQEAIRALSTVVVVLSGERHLSLDEALEGLETHGHIDGGLRAAYGGLFDYASTRRGASTDDARLVFVMCAALIAHLASRLPTQPPPPGVDLP